MCRFLRPVFAIAVLAVAAGPALAHGLGERYDLPLPLSLYLSGAAMVVALTFVMLAISARTTQQPVARNENAPEAGWTLPDWPGRAALLTLVRILSTALFILLVLAGLIGSPDPFKNPLPVSVWVLGWVGITYVCALFGNVWALINPWDNLFRLGEGVALRVRGGRPREPLADYPPPLGAWPAVALFLGFIWMELVWPSRDRPALLAGAILVYSTITWTGMVVFGRTNWLRNGEFLTIAFGLLARFAVIGQRENPGRTDLTLRPPAVGLLVCKPVAPSVTAFALLMLAAVTFDGLLETPLWAVISEAALASPVLKQIAGSLAVNPSLLLTSAALLVFPLLFASCYLLVAWLMAAAASAKDATSMIAFEIAGLFVLTLVPIAIGYHLSHYLSYLLIAGQFIIPIASDPFALGWNLFGTRLYLINIGIVDAQFIWYASLGLIVAGHVIAIWLAHTQAKRRFCSRHVILRSQLPMLALMVGYTALSLWILAQPIVATGS